jgi:GMP synthase-like glutamine amidotransferase
MLTQATSVAGNYLGWLHARCPKGGMGMRVALAHGSMPGTMTSGTMTTCLVVQHVEAEPSWAIGAALSRAGVRVDVRRVFAGEPLPSDVADHNGLVVMGGPMSACSDKGFATRPAEIALLGHALAGAVPTLGVCLGAQLLALAAGGAVYPGADGPEIGWSTVELSSQRAADALLTGLPERLPVLHWHGDTFDLPPGAARLARSARYPNQAFRVGKAAWGLQFHLEVTPDAVDGLLRDFAADAARAPGGAPAIDRATLSSLETLSPWRDLVFDRFAALVVARTSAAAPDGSPHRFADISES